MKNKKNLPQLPNVQGNSRFQFEIVPGALARWNQNLQARVPVENAAHEGEEQDAGTITIYDVIGESWDGTGTTARRISAALRSIGKKDVHVNINSPGGDLFEGIAIYNILRDHPGNVTTRVVGLAASSASVIAMAGDTIQVARAGFLMIHNVWVMAMGNRNDLRDAADQLEPFDAALADLYHARTGMDTKAIAKLMDKETWFSGAQAVDNGFADELLPADQVEESAADGEGANASLRRVDVALAKAGLPRSERRALIKELSGMPGAAAEPTPSAGSLERMIAICESAAT